MIGVVAVKPWVLIIEDVVQAELSFPTRSKLEEWKLGRAKECQIEVLVFEKSFARLAERSPAAPPDVSETKPARPCGGDALGANGPNVCWKGVPHFWIKRRTFYATWIYRQDCRLPSIITEIGKIEANALHVWRVNRTPVGAYDKKLSHEKYSLGPRVFFESAHGVADP